MARSGEPVLRNIAMQIDTENMSTPHAEHCLKAILAELQTRGEVTVKRAYGDFAEKALGSWDAALRAERVKRIAPAGEKGKKACDMLLVVDAMDLLHQNPNLDVFALATGDGDFAPLCDRLRESGRQVWGFGFAPRTSSIFIKACHRFVAVESLPGFRKTTDPGCLKVGDTKRITVTPPPDAWNRAVQAVKLLGADRPEGWVRDTHVADFLRRLDPAWDARAWGYARSSDFFAQIPAIEYTIHQKGRREVDVWVRERNKVVDPADDNDDASDVHAKKQEKRKTAANQAGPGDDSVPEVPARKHKKGMNAADQAGPGDDSAPEVPARKRKKCKNLADQAGPGDDSVPEVPATKRKKCKSVADDAEPGDDSAPVVPAKKRKRAADPAEPGGDNPAEAGGDDPLDGPARRQRRAAKASLKRRGPPAVNERMCAEAARRPNRRGRSSRPRR